MGFLFCPITEFIFILSLWILCACVYTCVLCMCGGQVSLGCYSLGTIYLVFWDRPGTCPSGLLPGWLVSPGSPVSTFPACKELQAYIPKSGYDDQALQLELRSACRISTWRRGHFSSSDPTFERIVFNFLNVHFTREDLWELQKY